MHIFIFLILDIDECTTGNNTCFSNSLCINLNGSYDCLCYNGSTGGPINCSGIELISGSQPVVHIPLGLLTLF